MNEFAFKDFNDWSIYDGASEGSGRSEKVWLISPTGECGLFKYPKTKPGSDETTSEHVSEHLAHQLGEILGVETARVDLGIRDGRVGSMSYVVNQENEMLIEGVNFITRKHPAFDANTLYDPESGKYYSIDHFDEMGKILPEKDWIEMMLFDYVIGNTDRHQSNWAILASVILEDDKIKDITIRKSPLYDNGSSLCCYVYSDSIDRFFSADPGPFNAMVGSKSKSMIRIDGTRKTAPTHEEVIKYLLGTYSVTADIANRFITALTCEAVDALLNWYPPEILHEKKNMLIRRYLKQKMARLELLVKESDLHAE